jgi:hypothetical protein
MLLISRVIFAVGRYAEMTAMETIETVRERALKRLEQMASEAGAKAKDRYWQSGPFNVQRWVERAFLLAISTVRETEPIAGETPADHLQRVAEKVRSSREGGPDDDDEGWFTGAIDEACRIISGACLREPSSPPEAAQRG